MNIESLRDFCLELAGTTEGMKWEHLCFMIEDKIYLMIALDDNRLCMKCDPEDFDELVARDGIHQAPHFARRQWIALDGINVLNEEELTRCIRNSRSLVLSKLPKKLRVKYD